MSSKDIIRKNFSRCADCYDSYSNIQKYIAAKLIGYSSTSKFTKILDIGCGTGNYTKMLRSKFPSAKITAMDISEEMIRVAKRKLHREKKLEFIVADAETVDLNDSFDLITSNACFHWFENLETALIKYKSILKENGIILFSVFGPLTFYQLSESLGKLYKKNVRISSHNFIEKDRLKYMLGTSFGEFHISEELYNEPYTSLFELLKTIKHTGTRGLGINGETIGKHKLTELEHIYKEKFCDIVSTYQILYCQIRS